MAAAISAKPTALPSKIKRPAPPALQTSSLNGNVSQSSSSPSISNKRLSTGITHVSNTPTFSNGAATPNGTNPRLGNRRKEPQKPIESMKARKSGAAESVQGDKRTLKKVIEPYMKTTSYMLKKYRKSPPSFILHLHPTHFRFDEQDGSFSYNSPMRVLLEHIKDQTVPHDMLDDLISAGIKFYENNLIVQIHDHRSSTNATQTTSNVSKKDKNQPFSIHNYNQYLTPSPYVPYPSTKVSEESESAKNTNSSQASGARANSSEKTAGESEQDTESASSNAGPRIFTTVLFHTSMSLQEEMLRYACSTDNRTNNRKQSQVNGRAPTSATMPHPPTPSSTGPGTQGPSSKKQKMMYTGKSLMEIESKIISSISPSLFLDSVKNLTEVQTLLRRLQDPLCNDEPPAPKSRKRTVKELEADEALAAEEQRFMLIMDERLVANSTGNGVGNGVGTDGESGVATFEARFEKFKALEEIKELHQETKQRAAEAKAQAQAQQHQQQQKAKLEQQEKERMLEQTRLREANNTRIQQEQARQNMMRQHSQQGQQGQQAQHQKVVSQLHSHPPTSGTVMATAHQLATTQAHHSSPIIRNMTPQNASSPLMMTRPNQGVPMAATGSNQGAAGSPPRPGSAMQHAHPTAVTMAQQRSQQAPSRNGTPSMQTPRLQQGTPVIRNGTPTPRMTHASPISATTAATPVMNQNMIGTPHPHQLTQQQHIQLMQRQQQIAQQQYQQRQQMQGSPPNMNAQMSPQNLQHLAAQQAHQMAQHRSMEEALRSQSFMQQQLNLQNGHNAHMANGMLVQQGQMQYAPGQQPVPGQPNWRAIFVQTVQTVLSQMSKHLMDQYGSQESIPPQAIENIRRQATERAKQIVTDRKNRHQVAIQQRQNQQHQQQRQQAGWVG